MIMKLLFFVLGLIHFSAVSYINNSFNWHSFQQSNGQLFYYFVVKLLALILTLSFYQLFPIIINGFKNKNKKIISFTKYAGIYFVICMSVLMITHPLIQINNIVFIAYTESQNFFIAFFPNWI